MEDKYIKKPNINLLYHHYNDDNKRRHEFESLLMNRDIISSNIKTGLDSIRNSRGGGQ